MPFVIILSTLALGLGLYIAWLVHGQGGFRIVVEPQADRSNPLPGEERPLISVIIPARNEERNLRRCLLALQDQTYPSYEIIVVDDRSTDATPGLLQELANGIHPLQIVHGEELPAGWAGKPHALMQGSIRARGEWLCFLDADTFADRDLLWSTFNTASQQHADMFSILTCQELGSFWERSVLPLVFMGLSFGFPAGRVNDPHKPDAISNGQFILIKRTVYDRIGGHAAVKDRVDEDKAIARVVKHTGFRLVLADGRKVASTRMYTSLPEMWEGWTKNIYLGLTDRIWLLLFGAVLGLTVAILLPFWLLGGLAWLIAGGGVTAAVVAAEAVILWGYLLWKRLQACRWFGISPGYAFTFPLGALIFTAMMIASAYKVLSGRGVIWKGRRYH